MITLYHGSDHIVEKPVFGEGKSYNDYGRGFYCTEHVELAYYQWLSCRSFAYMQRKGLGVNEVVAMYHPLHEADLSKFADVANSITRKNP